MLNYYLFVLASILNKTLGDYSRNTHIFEWLKPFQNYFPKVPLFHFPTYEWYIRCHRFFMFVDLNVMELGLPLGDKVERIDLGLQLL